MTRRIVPSLLAFLLCASAGAVIAAPAGGVKVKSVTLQVSNRIFTSFHDKVVAVPNKEFRVGDSEYTAKVIRFEPDFSLNLKTHAIASKSPEPNNPAFQIQVSRNGAVKDTVWAFFNMPPHYGVRDVLAFTATRIEFTNHATLAAPDTTAKGERGADAKKGAGK